MPPRYSGLFASAENDTEATRVGAELEMPAVLSPVRYHRCVASIRNLSVDPDLVSAVQQIFRDYADFLRAIQACHAFNFDKFKEEIAALPRPYTEADGDVLLAVAEMPAGTVAYRAAPLGAEAGACEIKRLFVLPAYRGKGLAEQLVRSALEQARQRGYRAAILDTEPRTMQAAEALYRKLGFVAYQPARPHNPVDVAYLRRNLG